MYFAAAIKKSMLHKSSIGIFGLADARKADAAIAAALKSIDYVPNRGVEAARATIFLLIKRGYFRNFDILIHEIERISDVKANILTARLDSASDPGADFIDKIKEGIRAQYGVDKVFLSVEIKPELIGGCRLTIGSNMQDFSLEGRLKQLSEKLLPKN
jgi:F0F1-type ATP synthase delta subunit